MHCSWVDPLAYIVLRYRRHLLLWWLREAPCLSSAMRKKGQSTGRNKKCLLRYLKFFSLNIWKVSMITFGRPRTIMQSWSNITAVTICTPQQQLNALRGSRTTAVTAGVTNNKPQHEFMLVRRGSDHVLMSQDTKLLNLEKYHRCNVACLAKSTTAICIDRKAVLRTRSNGWSKTEPTW